MMGGARPNGAMRVGRRGLIATAASFMMGRGTRSAAQTGAADSTSGAPDSPAAPILALRASLLVLARAGWPPSAADLKPLVAAAFDLPGITAAILGAAAASATPEQAARFAQAFGQRMVRELARNRPDPDTDRFVVQEIRLIAPGEWLVISHGERPGGTAVVLGWRVRALPGGPRIVDLLRDGVSAVQVQHDDIANALRTRPLDVLLADIEKRAAR